MNEAPITLAVSSDRIDELCERLTIDGFTFSDDGATTWSVLDTFDRRLERQGLRLVVRSQGAETTRLLHPFDPSGDRLVEAQPRNAAELPDEPLWAAVAGVIGVRALVLIDTITAEVRTATKRSKQGVPTTVVVIHGSPRIADAADATIPDHLVSLVAASTLKHGRAAIRSLEDEGAALAGTGPVGFIDAVLALGGRRRPSERLELDRDGPAVAGFRRALAASADQIAANGQGVIDDVDTEFLHDLRIAVRTTRTLLSHGTTVLPDTVGGPAKAQFRRLGEVTGPLRDLDVQLLGWSKFVAELPDPSTAAPLHRFLQLRRATVHAALVADLESQATRDAFDAWRRWLESPDDAPAGEHADQRLGKFVESRLRRAHTRLVRHGREITPASPPEMLHALRKDAKRLRYLLETFAPIIPHDEQRGVVRRLRGLQDNLGLHQDSQIQADRLVRVALALDPGETPVETYLSIGRLIEQLERRRNEARAGFADRFAAYDRAKERRAFQDVLDALR